MDGMCSRCCGVKKIVIGALLLLNAFVWPLWTGLDGWVKFVAGLYVLGGLAKLLLPNKCAHCSAMSCTPEVKGKKK